jgi:hypothetical protein
MRSPLPGVPLLAAVIALAPGTASAQQFSRPNYYTPSNIGNSPLRANYYYSPSNIGNSPLRPSFGMPAPPAYNANLYGPPGPGTPLPVGQAGTIANPLAPANLAAQPAAPAAAEEVPAQPSAVSPAPSPFALPGEEVPAGGNPAAPPAGAPGAEGLAPAVTASALGTYAVSPAGFAYAAPYALTTAARPSYYEGYYGRPAAPAYGSAYTAPQYQSSFYAPLRRVYGGLDY